MLLVNVLAPPVDAPPVDVPELEVPPVDVPPVDSPPELPDESSVLVLSVDELLDELELDPEFVPPDVDPGDVNVVPDCSIVVAIVTAWEMMSARTIGLSGVVVASCTGAVTVTWPVTGSVSTFTVTTTWRPVVTATAPPPPWPDPP